jgi:endoglucanase
LAELEPARWQAYQQAFITADGRVVDVGNGGISHTEGQGYGMLLAVSANDRETFKRLWTWTRTHLQREHDPFFSYCSNPLKAPPIQDKNNASDGDLLIAWALARADQRWHVDEYRHEAITLAAAIREKLLRPSAVGLLLPPGMQGFEHPGYMTVNPSYWIFPAFNALQRIDPSPQWAELSNSGRILLAQARFGDARLTPDWVRVTPDGKLELGSDQHSRFSFDALRIPLYSCWAGVEDRALLEAIATQWSAPDLPAWVNLKTGETAPYPLSPSQKVMNRILLTCLGQPAPPLDAINPNDYYASTLALLGELALRERTP